MFKYLVVKSFNWSVVENYRNNIKADGNKYQIWKDKEGRWCIKWWLQ